MGTNYYLHEKEPCPTCGHSVDEPRHIGKSSSGWCFELHVYPEDNIFDLDDWLPLFNKDGCIIKNEYDKVIDLNEMLITIRNRVGRINFGEAPYHYSSWNDFHRKTQSKQGPNNLLRHQLDDLCIKNGDGTWDCIVGEFS